MELLVEKSSLDLRVRLKCTGLSVPNGGYADGVFLAVFDVVVQLLLAGASRLDFTTGQHDIFHTCPVLLTVLPLDVCLQRFQAEHVWPCWSLLLASISSRLPTHQAF